VFDVTYYLEDHPGGDRCLIRRAGGVLDSSEDFDFHSKRGKATWRRFQIGELVSCDSVRSKLTGSCAIL